jgi:hypothetical protein
MNGIPITLDTERRRAVCIDLHSLDGRRNGVAGVRLAVPRDGAALRAEAGGRVLASIDTATFEVTKPPARSRRRRARPGSRGYCWCSQHPPSSRPASCG